jgi:hypothetical protein
MWEARKRIEVVEKRISYQTIQIYVIFGGGRVNGV